MSTTRQATDSPSEGGTRPQRLLEIAWVFLKLGCTSFGGPVAHLGYLHAELVTRRAWLSEAHYSDLVALAQALPGPTSSQVVLALGRSRGGLVGALLASFFFTLPSALLMIGFAYGTTKLGLLGHAGILHGLRLAAVAIVAQAVWQMGRKLCPDLPRLGIAALAATGMLLIPASFTQLLLILLGGFLGRLLPGATPSAPTLREREASSLRATYVCVGLFALLLLSLPLLRQAYPQGALARFDAFFRSGSLVFGGGHVVLPLLRSELVPNGWIQDDVFLAGYGAAQALPGPLFSFGAYLGTLMSPAPLSWLGGLACLVALFLPGWLLMLGLLPLWDGLRAHPGMQRALRGTNAAVVGLLVAALITPVAGESLHHGSDLALATAALLALEGLRLPPWLVVCSCAGLALLLG